MPRARNISSSEFTLTKVTPPKRNRATKQTLSDDLLAQLRENIDAESWLTNGVSYDDSDDGQKDATNDARVWRRDLARFLNIEERGVRTRVYKDDEGFHFALMLREALADS